MSKEDKLYLLRDRDDYIKKLSDDNVINVIGTKGSGKTSSALKYIGDNDYLVINCDNFYDMPVNEKVDNKYFDDLKKLLIKKYKNIPDDCNFIDCYNDILEFSKKKKKKVIIEGNVLYSIKPIYLLKGIIIVKRTGVIKSFVRSIKRDYPNKYFLDLEIKKHGEFLGRFYRLKNIIKRRKNIFSKYHEIEDIILELEKRR